MIAAAPATLYQQPRPVHPHYMLLPIEDGFNWTECLAHVREGQWYLVVFRSKHRADADEALLTELDNRASSAARSLPGFLFYFIGTPLSTGECLSFCLWSQQQEAKLASAQPEHREAVEKGLGAYEYYRLERYHVLKQNETIQFLALHHTAQS
ncbi:MAG: hypothetical protein SF029_20315 [bacterium]|nr:hypothetical protein [bacterium]